MKNHSFFMNKCLEIAKKGRNLVSPNPMVGCIIVYNGNIIGSGYHESYGESHAEINAINSVNNKKLLRKSIMYVNLEPCCHFGKTPPCCDIIIKYKIPTVVIGCIDSCKQVSKKGIKILKKHGVKVKLKILEKECQELNKRFLTFHEKERPYIILKWAESKDGFISPKNQNGYFWMTSNKSKKLVHIWRSQEDAILVGKITAKKDNPLLTVRETHGKNPIRIVIDKNLELSKELNIFNNDSETIIINNIKSKFKNTNRFIKLNFNNLIDNILKYLYNHNIQSVIVEGGCKTIQSFIESGKWDEARIFIADKILIDGILAPNLNKKFKTKKIIDSDILKIIYND